MCNLSSLYSTLSRILLCIDDLPSDCPDKILNDGFHAIRSSALGCLRRVTEFVNESIKDFEHE